MMSVKELPGAFCMGGGVYSDDEINDLIYQHIKKFIKTTIYY